MRGIATGAIALALSAALVAACADPDAEFAAAARSAMVGTPKADLLACAGVPDRAASVGKQDFLTYEAHGIESVPRADSVIVEDLDRDGRPTLRREWVTVFDLKERRCEATFTLSDGRVERLVYGGGGSPTQCAAIVANCVPPPR
jgi:hypothetical protein